MRRVRRVLAGLGMLLFGCHVYAAAQAASPSPRISMTGADLTSFVTPLIEAQLNSRSIVGAVAIAVKDGVVIYEGGYGLADVAQGSPMDTKQTVVRLGSISKLFTAVAIMQLVERGKLDLDVDVREYLDFEIPSADSMKKVTLRHLLSRQVPFEERIGGIASLSGDRSDLRTFLKNHWPSQIDVGDETPVYSNFAYAIAAYLVERASGERFEDYLQRQIFAPLGMTSTSANQPLTGSLASRVSQGYIRSDLPPTVLSSGNAVIHEVGSTAVCATAEDVARFMLALLRTPPSTSVPIISDSGLKQMFAHQVSVARGMLGLGLYSPLRGSAPFVGHEGDTGGFHSMLALSSDERFGFFVLYNSASAHNAMTSAAAELLDAIAARYFPDNNLDKSSNAPPVGHAAISGSYEASRRNLSTVFSLMALLSQVHIEGPLLAGQVFADGSDGPRLQVGPPFETYSLVPWWKSAKIVLPAVLLACLVTVVRLAVWPVQAFRTRRRASLRDISGTPRILARLGSFFQIAAIVMAAWFLTAGNVAVRLGEPYVVPLAYLMYAFGWFGVVGASTGVWDMARRWNQLGVWARGGSVIATSAAIVLAFFCVVWRIAGTNLEF